MKIISDCWKWNMKTLKQPGRIWISLLNDTGWEPWRESNCVRYSKSLLEAEERLLSIQFQTKLAEISLLQISGRIMEYI
jgi:hypothetical protein